MRSVMRLRASWRDLRASATAGGGLHPPAAADCSLLRRTGRERRFAVVRIDLAALREAVHRRGGTVNDALLVAVAGALRSLLAERGESVPVFRIAVMVGAMIVGKITVSAIEANETPLGIYRFEPALNVRRGDEIGAFHLGSTVVLLTSRGHTISRRHGPVKYGQTLLAP